MLTYNQPLLQFTLRGLQPSVCLRLWSPKFICDTLWNGSFLQCRNKICSASLEDIWTHRLPGSSDACTTQFLQVANYKLRTTLAEASGNFWLCATSKTNIYSSECEFMYFKFYLRILGGRMFAVSSFQIHTKTRIQDQDFLRIVLPRDVRMNGASLLKQTIEEL